MIGSRGLTTLSLLCYISYWRTQNNIDIKGNGKYMNQEKSKNRMSQALIGLVVFIFVILAMIFICAPLQMKFGMYGVALTELIFLAIALIGIKISKYKIKDVLAIKAPKFTELRGSAYIYIGSFCLSILCTTIISRFFPEMFNVSQGIGNVITGVSYPIAIIIVSILPGICEEALHRGYLLSTLNGYSSVRARVVIMGIIFGIFHLDPYRFAPTMILGMGLTYIMVKTGNLLLPMIFHALNNFISTTASFWIVNSNLMNQIDVQEVYNSTGILQSIGSFLFYLAPCIFFLYLGYRRLNNSSKRNTTITVFVVCGCLIIAGYALIFISVVSSGDLGMAVQEILDRL